MLSPQDRRHLEAAQGWIGLGDFLSANSELDDITPRFRAHPKVLRERMKVFVLGKRWDDAHTIATAILTSFEEDPEFHYDFAVICAQLLDTAGARIHLEAAFDRSQGQELKLRMLDERAFDALWREPEEGGRGT